MRKVQISLAAARVNAKMTQIEVAMKLGISRKTVVNWETGRTEPDLLQVRKLSDLYNIELDNIFLPTK